ncbi:short-chain dehydrogenase/reductase SDR [Streptomyces laurentii]|uniref:Short-chain dehydrogenase/reductase SDR n=1 Tax=Streptomyces laurentii TaxID=39478 RepID=A0A160P753_STRLU|nr:short-chain dehydrogenase/reductase SDR [Streptomyces laurentii]
MELSGARVLVAGATGALGGAITAELADRGARVALAGRDRGRLAHTARAYPSAPTAGFDAHDPGSCALAVHEAAAALQGLDVVVAFGSVAFGAAEEIGDEVAEHLMAVNHLAPAAFFRAALGILRRGSAIAAVTGVVAERPQPRMADYSVSKAALAAWLDAVRREARSAGVAVLEIRPGHLDTGFATRPVAGTAPPLPEGGDPRHVAGAVADALEVGAELLRSGPDKSPVVERRAR